MFMQRLTEFLQRVNNTMEGCSNISKVRDSSTNNKNLWFVDYILESKHTTEYKHTISQGERV